MKKVGEWTPIFRGTKEWDDREEKRMKAGHVCLSFGTIDQAIADNSKYSMHRMN